MDTTQQETPSILTTPPPPPGLLGTKIPSAVAFAVGILLFLLPFAEIKCGGTTLANKSGLDIALQSDWKVAGSSLFNKNDLKQKETFPEKESNSQLFAVVALGLGILGLLLSFAETKAGGTGGVISGALSAAALIGLLVDMNRWFNNSIAKDAANKTNESRDNLGFDNMGNLDNMMPTLNFTPWFYVAVIAFLAAAFFSFKRMRLPK